MVFTLHEESDHSIEAALERLKTRPWIDTLDYCTIYSRSRTAVYAAIGRGEIKTLDLDRKVRILSAPLREELQLAGVLD